MDGGSRVLVGEILLPVHSSGSNCCLLVFSNPTMERSSERPGCLIFSIFTAATLRAHQFPFGSLKYLADAKDTLRGPLSQSQWDAFPTCPLLSSPWPLTQKTSGIPLSLQGSRWILHSCALTASAYNVHWYLLKIDISVGLMCQAIKSTQSSMPGHPFPPPGWRQGPSIPVPGQSIHCLTFAMPDQKSPHQAERK